MDLFRYLVQQSKKADIICTYNKIVFRSKQEVNNNPCQLLKNGVAYDQKMLSE